MFFCLLFDSVLKLICFEYSFCTVIWSAVSAVSQSELYFLKRHTCGCTCGAINFWGLWKRLRLKNVRVVARMLVALLL